MTEERRYRDHEIRDILALAGREDGMPVPSVPDVDGLTLAELMAVARDVGISRTRVVHAVVAFEKSGESLPRGTTLGLPSSVGHVVPLTRSPTPHEWELLVAELRATFRTGGHVTSHGGVRQWSSGPLHVFLEPTAAGYQLRLTDLKKAPLGGVVFGGVTLLISLVMVLLLLSQDAPGFRLAIPALLSALGTALIMSNVMALPGWVHQRETLMEQFANRATLLLGGSAPDTEPTQPNESRPSSSAGPSDNATLRGSW